LRNIILVAKREYLEQIHGHAFIISTIMLPVLILGMLTWSFIANKASTAVRHIVIVSDNAELGHLTRNALLSNIGGRLTVDVVTPLTSNNMRALEKQVVSKAIDGVFNIDISSSGDIESSFITRPSEEFNLLRIETAVNRAAVRMRMITHGLMPDDVNLILKKASVEAYSIDKYGQRKQIKKKNTFLKPLIMIFLLSMPILLYGLDTARAIIEEKSSRIYEVMLSVTSPDDVLAGKLIGVGAVGLTQMSIWGGSLALLLASSLFNVRPIGTFSVQLTFTEGLMFLVYFVLNFAIFNALFSGLAATCETAQDLQKFMPIAITPLYVSVGILPILLKDPNSKLAIVASLFPFTSPYVMISRMGLELVPLWQVAISIGILTLSSWIVLWLSSRLYRAGILMYGKRTTLQELLRSLRYS